MSSAAPPPFEVPAAIAELRGTAPPRVRWILWVLVAIGIAAFAGMAIADRQRLWLDYLADFLFFTGAAQAAVVWSAVTRGCNGRWARPLQRMAEAMAGVLPLSVLLFLPLMFAHRTIWPWWGSHLKTPWLAPGFLLGRDLGILIAMAWASVWYLRTSIGPDLARDSGGLTAGSSAPARAAQRKLARRWVVLAFLYCYLYGVLGHDLNVSLNLGWYDYIYPWFFFITDWYAGCALVSVLACAWRKRLDAGAIIHANILHDNGELTFAFAIFWAYQFWSQFMVLWYANRQDDIRVLIRLSQAHPWVTLSWVTLTLAFFLPFGFGLSRSFKRRPATLTYMACLSLAGLWLQHNLIVDAQLWYRGFPPLLTSAALGCGFLGAYGLVYLWVMRRVPVFPVRDPVFHEALVWNPPRH